MYHESKAVGLPAEVVADPTVRRNLTVTERIMRRKDARDAAEALAETLVPLLALGGK